MCINYRRLNKVTIKNSYPLPRADDQEMNDIFREQLRKFVVIFLDDILVYSRTLEEHAKYVCFVLQTLCDKQFVYAKISKCKFFKKSITYLGHIITERGVKIDPSRIEKIKLWPTLRNIREVRSFLGFVEFFPWFCRVFVGHPSFSLSFLINLSFILILCLR